MSRFFFFLKLRCDVRQGNMSSQLLGIRNFFFFSVVESAFSCRSFASQTPRVQHVNNLNRKKSEESLS
jgi:hypothetical protein